MSAIKLSSEKSLLLVIDMQEKFLNPIFESERVENRVKFLCEVARLFEVPVLATEQYPERMGGTIDSLLPYVGNPHRKMEFSAFQDETISRLIKLSGRTQIVVVGIETHICISQTCLDLIGGGFEVVVCPDAVSARSQDRHKLGMERLRDAGITPAHTEAIAYDWCHSADNQLFRNMLSIVKNSKF
jgi:nicotinamidase-related amidase